MGPPLSPSPPFSTPRISPRRKRAVNYAEGNVKLPELIAAALNEVEPDATFAAVTDYNAYASTPASVLAATAAAAGGGGGGGEGTAAASGEASSSTAPKRPEQTLGSVNADALKKTGMTAPEVRGVASGGELGRVGSAKGEGERLGGRGGRGCVRPSSIPPALSD